MKKIGTVIIVILIMIATTTVVVAIPLTPETYWGYATLDDAPAANGTPITVEVYETGEVVGNTTVADTNGLYSLDVYISDEYNLTDGYALNGDNLTFKIDGIVCSVPAPGTETADEGGVNHYSGEDHPDDPFNITASHPPLPVPEFNMIGLLALIGILTIILAFATSRRKKE